ncbi:hypothetical protein [Ichthyenterobacterium magnum]|uniref:YhhN-like protein n=1 Tax=Ichthyenterobacterium magnum TaxID=1230530 RepID=A0A420DLF2_9FLAO|nr:hypothetical protein [Ichthyenterobacterium magnum]RKE95073.1 hypothetical protein BXY80_1256 [Ichthyenterobacterium magnum]
MNSTMKKLVTIAPNRVLVVVLFAMIILSFYASYYESIMIPKVIKLITTTLLLTFFFCQKNRIANVFFTIFILFFLGDVFSVFNFGLLALKLSNAFYIGSYLLLVFILFGRLKHVKFEGLVSVYLVLVLTLNTYFLYVLYNIAKESLVDDVSIVLYVLSGIALIGLVFFAFAVYLSRETSQSIIFLIMAFCLAFSDVLGYVCDMYVYYWLFETFERVLHIIGLYLFYIYVFNHHSRLINSEHTNASVLNKSGGDSLAY